MENIHKTFYDYASDENLLLGWLEYYSPKDRQKILDECEKILKNLFEKRKYSQYNNPKNSLVDVYNVFLDEAKTELTEIIETLGFSYYNSLTQYPNDIDNIVLDFCKRYFDECV